MKITSSHSSKKKSIFYKSLRIHFNLQHNFHDKNLSLFYKIFINLVSKIVAGKFLKQIVVVCSLLCLPYMPHKNKACEIICKLLSSSWLLCLQCSGCSTQGLQQILLNVLGICDWTSLICWRSQNGSEGGWRVQHPKYCDKSKNWTLG